MTQLGRYELLETLGQGAMGRVYLAMDPKLRRHVAVKVLHDHVAADPERRAFFFREARAAAALDHPNILQVFDYSGPDEAQQYIVMQRLKGVDLRTILDTVVQVPELFVLGMVYEIALALENAHENGLVHRDLKPANLFLEPDGRVVLGDFGIAKAYESDDALGKTAVIEQSKILGTPLYMPPERLKQDQATPASDIFSLGAVIFHMLCGVPPFAGKGQELLGRIVEGRVRFIRSVDPSISVETAALVHAMLSREPAKRPTSGEVAAKVRELLAARGIADTRAFLQRCFHEPEVVTEELYRAQRQRAPAEAAPDDSVTAEPEPLEATRVVKPTGVLPTAMSARRAAHPDWRWIVGAALLGVVTGVVILRGLAG